MSKECTTHHFACGCREEKFKALERENAALQSDLNKCNNLSEIRRDAFEDEKSARWAMVDRVRELERENAALRAVLVNAEELERYSGSDDRRQWGKCSSWLHPDDAVVILSAKALDVAKKEAQP